MRKKIVERGETDEGFEWVRYDDGSVRTYDGGGFLEYSAAYLDLNEKRLAELRARLGLRDEDAER